MGAAGAHAAAAATVSMNSILKPNPLAPDASSTSQNKTQHGFAKLLPVDQSILSVEETDEDVDLISKKAMAVLMIVVAGILIGIVINFVNVHTDFQDLQDFYKGYLGRKMLISEGKLTSRDYINAIKEVNEKKLRMSHKSPRRSHRKSMANGQAGGSKDLEYIQDKLHKENPHCHSNFAAFTSIKPFKDVEPLGHPDHLEWLQTHLPLYAASYIEDEDLEWKDLDYSIEIGEPPEHFSQFIRQYDWNVFACDKHTLECELELRRNLFYQFRKWKKRRRRRWQIVVTERAKKEMAEQDHTIGSRR